jgi:hypothetical protein
MRGLHVAADVIERAAGARAQKIDQQLLFAAQAVLRPVLPEPPVKSNRSHETAANANAMF